jgi:hypothetical protein
VDELHRRVVRKIREQSRRRKIPISHLPDRAAVARSHFWEVMKGKKSPTLKWLNKIAGALDVDAGDLVVRLR